MLWRCESYTVMATIAEALEAAAPTARKRRRDPKRRAADRQRQRERRVENARLAAIAEVARLEREAVETERRDEFLASGVLRRAIYSVPIRLPEQVVPDGLGGYRVMAGEVRTQRLIRGPMVQIVDGMPLAHGAALHRFSDRQNRAARKLQLDWRDVGTGCGASAVDYERTGGGSSGDRPIIGADAAMLGQIEARIRLEATLTWIGAFTPGIMRVVLDRVPIPEWAAEVDKSSDDAVAWIRAGLDRLAGFYWPPRENANNRGQFLTFAPPRSAYDVAPPDTIRRKIVMDEPDSG